MRTYSLADAPPKRKPKPKGKVHAMSVILTGEQHQRLLDYLLEHRTNASALVRKHLSHIIDPTT